VWVQAHATARRLPLDQVQAESVKIFTKLCGEASTPVIAGMGWFLRKVWRRLYENIHIDAAGIQILRDLGKKGIDLMYLHAFSISIVLRTRSPCLLFSRHDFSLCFAVVIDAVCIDALTQVHWCSCPHTEVTSTF
jgi:hypothetical protein